MIVIKDTTGAIAACADMDDAKMAATADFYAKAVGEILHKAYPDVFWHVTVNPHMGKAGIRIPAVSMEHGIEVALTRDVHSLQERVKMLGGEMLERFRISRVTGNSDHLRADRNLRGTHKSAAKGEL